MTGIPGTAGFAGKYALFSAAFTSYTWLIVVALVLSAVSVAYYFRAIIAMYFRDSEETTAPVQTALSVRVALVLCTLLNLGVGIAPLLITSRI
jgi:NADH-quinone oxidoreductase subunit N